MVTSEATPFLTHEVAQRNSTSTAFTVQSPWAHDGGSVLGFISSQVFRTSTWSASISGALVPTDPVRRARSEVGEATAGRRDDSVVWLVSLATREPEPVLSSADDTGEDRRIYSLAAVDRLQRLLGLTQEEVAALIGVSRPTLWNWEQGRVPQERSVRRLYDIAGTVDLLVDWFGDEDRFDAQTIARDLGLGDDVLALLAAPDGSRVIREHLFRGEESRRPALTLIPTLEELKASSEMDASDTSSTTPVQPRARRLRQASRRPRRKEVPDDPERDSGGR